jgi:hypothetical protein
LVLLHLLQQHCWELQDWEQWQQRQQQQQRPWQPEVVCPWGVWQVALQLLLHQQLPAHPRGW